MKKKNPLRTAANENGRLRQHTIAAAPDRMSFKRIPHPARNRVATMATRFRPQQKRMNILSPNGFLFLKGGAGGKLFLFFLKEKEFSPANRFPKKFTPGNIARGGFF